jgi:hypothetical protein
MLIAKKKGNVAEFLKQGIVKRAADLVKGFHFSFTLNFIF